MNPIALVLGFAPLAVFTLLTAFTPVAAAALAGAALALVALAVAARRRRGVPALPIVTGVTLVLIAVVALVGGPGVAAVLAHLGRGLASVVLAAYILLTAPFAPFTAWFARASVSAAVAASAGFLALNRRISLAWGVAVLATGVTHLAAAGLDGSAGRLITIVLNWGIPLVATTLAFRYTRSQAAHAAEGHHGVSGHASAA